MKIKETKFSAQIIDADQLAITNAMVTIKSDQHEFKLECENKKGFYTTEEDIPKGTYTISVKKRPFEEDSRKVTIGKKNQNEVFILRRKGVPYYYRGKVKTPFKAYEDRIVLLIPEKSALASKGEKKESLDLKQREKVAKGLAKKHKITLEKTNENLLLNGVFVCSFPKNATKKRKMEICENIEKEETNTALPILKLTEKHAALLTNEMMVKFEDGVEKHEIEKIAKEFKLKIKRKISVLGNFYHFTTGKVPTYDILEIINKLAVHEDVIFAEPNLATTVEEDAVTPTDFLFPEQWDHQILNTPDAWQFLRNVDVNRTFGSPDLVIGVVDSGVDPNHPDFNGTVSDGSSKTYQAFDFANMVANNNSLSSDHGTACASAVASSSNNASDVIGTNEGVTGVAGNCRVLAIRGGGDEARYADMYLWAAGFDPESDEDDFPEPISQGADVITNSFGYSTGSPISGTMSAVFDKLTDDGRNGNGTMLFFSAGNNTANNPNGQDLDLTFYRPWGMYDRCFSVAASSLATDGISEQKTWYSCFGSVIDFCAPSSNAFVHDPPNGYGTFTATRVGNPEGKEVAVGRPTIQNALSANANSGTNVITVNNDVGFAVGQAIMINNAGSGTAETHSITAINTTTNQITLDASLFNTHASGTNVFASQVDYRNDFGGTSHATPLCAGVAALMISVNPQLSWTQVGNLMKNTAIKINPGENNSITTVSDADGSVLGTTNGRWQDVNGNLSNSPAYDGNPIFSEFYGFGRIDAAAAVREAGWDIDLVTEALDFNDVPEGDTVSRAIRFNVRSLWAANFNIIDGPGAPFNPLSTSESIGPSTDSSIVQEVYLWITYTGTNDGDEITMADGRTVTVRNPETEQEWVIPITANVIERPTSAIMLCLDQSGSMDFPSGIGSSKRIDILRFSANIMVDVLHEGNGLGIVSFDQDPHDVFDFTGPVGPPVSPSNPFDQDRTDMKGAITNFNPNLLGSTAIGDGIERAWTRLNPVGGYTSKSVIVFTDGKETEAKYISEVTDQINDRMFAIGLGKAENIEPAALNEAVNSSEGYMLLANDLGADSIFKLAKYFLQIQADVNNEEIVVDPDGTLYPGQVHKIPFLINEADNTIDVIVMVPNPSAVEFYLETPNGSIIKPSDSTSIPGVQYSYGSNVVFYRLNLPLPIGVPERAGTWNAILTMSKKYKGHKHTHALAYTENASTSSGNFGKVPYSLLVHSSSNLNMKTTVSQSDYEPGATIKLSVHLSQYGIPLDTKCSVTTGITLPNKQVKTLQLANLGEGNFETQIVADSSGIYQFLTKANGLSFRGKDFSREQIRNASVWRGGNRPSPGGNGTGSSDTSKEEICKLISCLLNDKNISEKLKERMLKQGINLDGMLECLKKYCKSNPTSSLTGESLSKLKLNYEVLLRTFNEVLK